MPASRRLLAEAKSDVLRALIGMMYEAGLGPTPVKTHLQGVDDEL